MKRGTKKAKRRGGNKFLRFCINAFIIFFTVIYLWMIGPLTGFMGNKLPDENLGESLIDSDDDVLDMGELDVTDVPTEAPTETPEPTEVPTEEPPAEPTAPPVVDSSDSASKPNENQGPSLPYVPNPIVQGVTKANGSQINIEKDAKNVLLLGIDEATGLADTIMVISICDRTNQVQVLSLSRDAYVPYAQSVKDIIKRNGESLGIYKLNACLHIGRMVRYSGGKFGNAGIDFMCNVLETMFAKKNLVIHDYMYIDESAFIEVIDLFGGLNVYVNEDWYSASGDEIGKIIYKKGYHFMNGREAYNYVLRRGRFGPNGPISSSGDPYRKANQLGFMRDFAKQVVTVENVGRFPELMDLTSKYIFHSLNSVAEITEYSKYAMKFAKGGYDLKMTVVTGESYVPAGVAAASYVNIMKG